MVYMLHGVNASGKDSPRMKSTTTRDILAHHGVPRRRRTVQEPYGPLIVLEMNEKVAWMSEIP